MSVIAGLALSPPAMAADELLELLSHISDEITALEYSGKTGTHSFDFAWDTDFPCSSTLTEHSELDGDRWLRQYRFELSDLETGQLLAAKDRRRAISYYGVKTSKGIEKKFSPKKISAIHLRTSADSTLSGLFDAAIHLCEERNSF